MRLAQAQVQYILPNIGMATAIDLGDPESPFHPIHPRHKKPLGKRLELWAENRMYGIINSPPSGPLFQGLTMHIDADSIMFTLRYAYANEGMKLRGTAFCSSCCLLGTGFEVVSKNGTVFPVSWIGSSNRNEWYGKVQKAVEPLDSLRYGWGAYPQCVLVNQKNDIPSPPFIHKFP